jgi:4,5-DOPA dioxygenase extradiol
MNAIQDNPFSRGWRDYASKIPRPEAILCVSAHWETWGTRVTAMQQPRTIHDFGGFPQALFEVQYAAPGSPDLAEKTRTLIEKTSITPDLEWGLDHGCWSVLNQMYPGADFPVVQLSMDYTQPAQFHYDLARELAPLRRQGVLSWAVGTWCITCAAWCCEATAWMTSIRLLGWIGLLKPAPCLKN